MNSGQLLRIEMEDGTGNPTYTGDGTSGMYIWGIQNTIGAIQYPYQRTTTVAETLLAPLTIGSNYALNAPFPGSLALLKLSATAPTADQIQFSYEQEKQMFRAGAQVLLPAATAVTDLAYDELQDKWVAQQASYESSWTGLVRTATDTPSAGTFSGVKVASGVKVQARATTTPGVDLTMPAYNLAEELERTNEQQDEQMVTLDFTAMSFTCTTVSGSSTITTVVNTAGTPYIGMAFTGAGIPAGTTILNIVGTTYYLSANATASASLVVMKRVSFPLTKGYSTVDVFMNGLRERLTTDYTISYDGFVEYVNITAGVPVGQLLSIDMTRSS
jgi:hypothetical protein